MNQSRSLREKSSDRANEAGRENAIGQIVPSLPRKGQLKLFLEVGIYECGGSGRFVAVGSNVV
jgi:hypothetical protein